MIDHSQGGAISAPEPRRARYSSELVLLVTLCCAAFALSLALELRLFDERIPFRWDVWFHSDPNLMMPAFAGGNLPPEAAVRHPLLAPLISFGVRMLEGLLHAMGLLRGEAPERRAWTALLVVPAVNALRTGILFTLFHRISGRAGTALVVCVLDAAAFASLTVGSVPESYALSAACIAAMFWLFLAEQHVQASWAHLSWVTLGALATGITLTNLLPLTVLYAAWARRNKIGLAATIIRTVAMVLFAAAIAIGTALMIPSARKSLMAGASSIVKVAQPADRKLQATEVLWAMGHTFVAPAPGSELHAASPAQGPAEEHIFSYAPPYSHGLGSWWRVGITLVILAVGAVGWRACGREDVVVVCVAIVAANFTLHLFFGDHFVLYQLHWSPALLVLAGGVALVGRRAIAGTTVLALFTLVTVASSAVVMRNIFARLAQP